MQITKKLFLSILVLTFAFHLIAGGDSGYNIKFRIKGAAKDSNCYLANSFADKHFIQDTAKVDENGRFVFTGKNKLPGGLYVLILPQKKSFEFILDKVQEFTMETDTSDFLKNMKITGSDDNKMFYEYLGFLSAKQKEAGPLRELMQKIRNNKDSTKLIAEKITGIDKEVKTYFQNFIKQHPKTLTSQIIATMLEPEIPEAPKLSNGRTDSTFAFRYMRAHFWDSYDFSDERLLNTPILYSKIKHFIDNLTYPIPDSIGTAIDLIAEKARVNKEVFKYVVGGQTYAYESSNVMGMDAVFVHLTEKYYMTKQAFWVDSAQNVKIVEHAMALKPLLIGKYAPNLTLKDSSLNDMTLYDIPTKFIIVYFWDYGCGHCKKITPVLADWYHKSQTRGIEVFAVGTETNAAEWKKYIKENHLDWVNVYDPDSRTNFRKMYNITSTPAMFILDANKKIIANRRLEVDQLDGLLYHYQKQKEKELKIPNSK